MNRTRVSAGMTMLAATAILIVLPSVYLTAYFWRASVTTWPVNVQIRGYQTEWEAKAFTPAAKMQTIWTGTPVHTVGPMGEVR